MTSSKRRACRAVPGRNRAPIIVLTVLAVLAAPSLRAGLRFQPADGPNGADVRCLASDATRVWAGTYRGVWKYEQQAWTPAGLSDRTVSSLGIVGGSVYAATGDAVWLSIGGTSWTAETLPGSDTFRTVLVSDGTSLWAAGRTVTRKTAGTWTSLPAISGIAVSGTLVGSDLAVGLLSGGALRLTSGAWVALAAGLGASEAIAALLWDGANLWAGTPRGLYAWTGSAWSLDSSFGTHDVRGISSAGGVLRAATADAGVRRKSGASWVPDNDGLLSLSTRVFAGSPPAFYLATGGGPVYVGTGSGWTATSGLPASVVSDIVSSNAIEENDPDVLVGSHGAGVQSPIVQLPSGCGDVSAVAQAPSGSTDKYLAATNCGIFSGGAAAWTAANAGLPSGVGTTSLSSTSGFGTFAGTNGAGLYRYNAGGWTQDSTSGILSTSSVNVLRDTWGSVWAATPQGLFYRTLTLPWTDGGDGLPVSGGVSAIGGRDPVYVGLAGGGAYRRDGPTFREDRSGLPSTQVFSIDWSRDDTQGLARLFAAGGKGGLLVKRDGGWASENSGLPSGADVRVVRSAVFGNSFVRNHAVLRVGTAGSGVFVARTESTVRTVPVVLDVVGATGARFRSELVIGRVNDTSSLDPSARMRVSFTPAPGFAAGGGTATLAAPDREIRAADALEFLRSIGIPVPQASAGAPVAGSLSISWIDLRGNLLAVDRDYALARTYTQIVGGGSYGLFFDAPSDLEAAEEKATVYGLRSVAGTFRSNLAIACLPIGDLPIQLSVQVYSASGAAAGAPLTATLAPGEWTQFNNVLGLAGLPDGSYGYAVVTRTDGTAPFSAYGIVNDMATSDGSYLPMIRPGGRAAARRLVVPVVLDVLGAANSHYTTELTLANDGPIGTPVDLVYQPAPGFGSVTGVPTVTVTLAAREQRTIPDVIAYLRSHGMNIPDPATGGPQAGTLSIHFRYLDALDFPQTVALARTSTPNPDAAVGGSFGLFYPALAHGGGARSSARVPALSQTASVRSNLAVVHTGGGSELPITLSAQLYDAATGAAVGAPLVVTLQPGDWVQWSKVLELSGALSKTTAAYAVVTRTAGDDTFFAYGVLNDNVTSDGSFISMIPAETY